MIKDIFRLNKVIFTIVIMEFFMNGALGTIAQVFAIFLNNEIIGGGAKVAGFAAAIYWIVKSIFQLPIARFLDKTDGEADEFWALFFGYLLSAIVYVMYYFATLPWHIYLAQALLGFLYAWAVPAWYALFTRNVDKFKIGFEWSLYSVISVGIATAISSALAGFLVDWLGFRIIFLIVAGVVVLVCLYLLSIKKYISDKKETLERVLPEKFKGMNKSY